MRKFVPFGLLVGSVAIIGCTSAHSSTPAHGVIEQSVVQTGCVAPAPTTARGYTALWAKLPVAQWGGGDVSISVKLGTRTVWLYGDTLSTGRFVHSSAIIQHGGCLHVSHGGAQLLPNMGTTWYWVARASAYSPSSVKILAESVHRTGVGPWDFITGQSRYALASLNGAGDLTFTRWLTSSATTPKPTGTLIRVSAGHVEYGQVVHRDIRLADGRYLLTTCQNWDDGRLHAPRAYAPLFSEA
jgi:hypothetical protein